MTGRTSFLDYFSEHSFNSRGGKEISCVDIPPADGPKRVRTQQREHRGNRRKGRRFARHRSDGRPGRTLHVVIICYFIDFPSEILSAPIRPLIEDLSGWMDHGDADRMRMNIEFSSSFYEKEKKNGKQGRLNFRKGKENNTW